MTHSNSVEFEWQEEVVPEGFFDELSDSGHDGSCKEATSLREVPSGTHSPFVASATIKIKTTNSQ